MEMATLLALIGFGITFAFIIETDDDDDHDDINSF